MVESEKVALGSELLVPITGSFSLQVNKLLVFAKVERFSLENFLVQEHKHQASNPNDQEKDEQARVISEEVA